jgi:hypothetical protein
MLFAYSFPITKHIPKIFFLTIILFLNACSSDDSPEPQDNENPNFEIKVVTAPVTDIIQIKAASGGEITGGQDGEIISRGVVWSTSPIPTLNDNFTINGTGIGIFSSSLLDLEVETTYYVRAYATTQGGTVYGNEISFVTLEHRIFNGFIILSSQESINGFGSAAYSIINGGIIIQENIPNSITSLAPLESIQVINDNNPESYSLQIIFNSALTNLNGLQNLKNHNASITITGNSNLSSLSGLDNLTTVDGYLQIASNPIVNMEGLNSLAQVGKNFYVRSDQLVNFSGMENLQMIGEDFYVFHVGSSFKNFEGLSNLSSIGATFDLSIATDYSFTGLTSLTSIGDKLYLLNNENLTSLEGLNALTSIGGGFIVSNNSLMSLDGLENLSTVSNSFYIEDNPMLTDINGLANLSSVGFVLNLRNNDSLMNLNGLSALVNVGNGLKITHNNDLSNFCGLQNFLINGTLEGEYIVHNNAYNPTPQDIIDGNCSL